LASPSKVLFTLSPYDARELALEFAKDPQNERYVVSQQPVRDLLDGHHNPQIARFVNKYLRYLVDKRDDIRADMEGTRIARMIDLDTAGFYGAEAQEEGVIGGSHISSQIGAINARQSAILRARMHGIKLGELHEQSNQLRVTLRELNRFLTEVMEGRRRAGQEAFSDFLISLAAGYSALPEEYAGVLGLYIKLSYGDPGQNRTIPFELAKSQALYSEEVRALTRSAEKKTDEERLAFRTRFIPEEGQERAGRRMREREQKIGDRQRAMEGKIRSAKKRRGAIRVGNTGSRAHHPICPEDSIWYPPNVYTWYIWLCVFPDIENLVFPYRTATFNDTCEYLMDDGEAAKTIAKLDESLKLVKYPGYGFEAYMEYMQPRVVRDLKDFLHRYGEGALVIIALLDCAGKGGWQGRQDSDISVSEFPGIEGKDPVDTWCLVERLRVLMHNALGDNGFSSVFAKYLDSYRYSDLDDRLYQRGFQTSISSYTMCDDIRYREDVRSLEKLVRERWSWFILYHFAAGENWKKLSAPVRCYVLCRAADRISFGERYSSLPLAAFAPYEERVGALVSLSNDTKARFDEAEEKEEAAKERKRIEEECAEKVARISYGPPESLGARVLDAAQIRTVRDACIEEIKYSPQAVYEVAGTIDEFAVFCELLAQPDNRIKARHINTRAEADMVNEMARVLTSIPKYTAYAKLVQEKTGEPIVWKGRVQPAKLSDVSAGAPETARLAIEKRALDYARPREEIREEIARRQQKWRRRVSVEAPSGATAEKKPVDAPKQGVAPPDEEAPPPRVVFTKEGGGEEDGGQAPEDAGKVRLVYRSDFTKPTGWDENHSEAVKVFRLDGYYHILVFDTNHYVYFNPPIIMDNFRAQVEAEFTAQTGVNGECGLVFGARSANGENFYHMFGIRPDGNYRLDARVSKEYRRATDWMQSEFINRGDRTNSLMVERSGKEITVGVNGNCLVTVISEEITSGFVGMFVRTPKDDYYAEARFRNFLLYAIE
jgi:hypothetical protein